jgi:hypothetical protein
MKMKKLAVVAVIFYLCVGVAWAQKTSNYQMDVIVAANSIIPQTTSMIYISAVLDGSSSHVITDFDNTRVNWIGLSSTTQRRGVIIPAGTHTLTVARISSNGQMSNARSFTFDFRPGCFYFCDNTGFQDYTNDLSYFSEKAQMELIIQRNATAQQGTTPAQSGGLMGALSRAAQTVMGNIQQGDTIAIISFTGENGPFVQEELEVLLVNSRFIVVDRNQLDQIRREQQFQLSGDVDDQTAVSIGQFAGAQVVITGSISGTGDLRRLRLRALSTQTARVLAAASEAF